MARYSEDVLGIRLDRWARRVLNRALAYGPDGRLLHRLYLASVARQNGKTAMVRALIGWALTARHGPDWRLILGLAHDRAQARIPYLAVLADLQPVAHRVGPSSRGGLNLTRYLGIRSAMFGRPREYHTASREARDSIRSLSVDLGAFDEVRTQRTFDTWAALEPTTTARPEPLIFAISTAGDERSVLLRSWFDQGRRIIEGAEPMTTFGMTWYAPPDDVAPDDPRALKWANPSYAEGRLTLAGLVGSGTIRPGSAQWLQERLNLWSDAADEWLPAGVWRRQIGAQPAEWGRVAFGVEVTPTWRRATVAVALETDAGSWAGVAGELDASRTAAATISPAELIALVAELAAAWHPALICYSAAAAAAPHLEAMAETGRIEGIGLGPRQIRAASGMLRSELNGGRLFHLEDALLAEQSGQARPSSAIEAGDWYFSIRESVGEIDALRALAWAEWGLLSPEARVAGPQIHI